jgi:predicted CoA-binding protein
MGEDECRYYPGPQDACTDEDIGKILRMRTIAIVGLSNDPGKISHVVASYLEKAGYDIIPVNPNHDMIMGKRCYPSVQDIPQRVDIVNVFRRPRDVMPVVEDAIKAGAQVVWLQLQIVNEDAYEKGLQAGLSMVMNRCIKVEHQRLMA